MDTTNKYKIESLMSGCYEPTLLDVKRIYNEYSLNKGEIAGVLSDVFGWLAQDPMQYEYKNGKIYARAEVDDEDILVIHFIYINEMDEVFIEQKLGNEEDITSTTIENYIPDIKRIINDILLKDKMK